MEFKGESIEDSIRRHKLDRIAAIHSSITLPKEDTKQDDAIKE